MKGTCERDVIGEIGMGEERAFKGPSGTLARTIGKILRSIPGVRHERNRGARCGCCLPVYPGIKIHLAEPPPAALGRGARAWRWNRAAPRDGPGSVSRGRGPRCRRSLGPHQRTGHRSRSRTRASGAGPKSWRRGAGRRSRPRGASITAPKVRFGLLPAARCVGTDRQHAARSDLICGAASCL